jgi:hypothetical protein
VLEKEVVAKKEAEIAQQIEVQQKAQEIEAQLKGNLEQAQASLGEPRIT